MKRKTVSLCMIARDEEATIGMTIKSVLALVDEVIVVDTGSQDNTRIIAEGYGSRVIDLAWQDDFATARNAGLDEANGDWILVLDADEHLQPVRPVEFQQLLNERHVAGYRLQMVSPRNEKVTQSFNLVRLFRNVPEVRYHYPIHEQIVPSLNRWAADRHLIITDADLTIMHEGYRPEKRARKRDRNQRILQHAVTDYPDEPYFAYQLACENLAMLDDEVLPVAGLAGALGYLNTAWRKLEAMPARHRRDLPYAADLVAKLAGAMLAQERSVAAREVLETARTEFGDQLVLLLPLVAAKTRYLQEYADRLAIAEIASLLDSTRDDIHILRSFSSTQPVASSSSGGSSLQNHLPDERLRSLYPLRYLGELALLEGHISEAAELFEKALTRDDSYSAAWLGLAECARFVGDRKRALRLYLRAVTENEWNHRAWLRGCSLLDELDFHDNAESWWSKVASQFPEHPEVLARGGDHSAIADTLHTTG